MLVVIHPAIGAVLAAKAIFERVLAVLEKLGDLGLDALKIVRVDALAPEIRIVEIFARTVAEQLLDIGADEGGGVIAARLEAVDHRGRGAEQLR
jgi:hypothetical protein